MITSSLGPKVNWTELGRSRPFQLTRDLKKEWSRAFSLVCEEALRFAASKLYLRDLFIVAIRVRVLTKVWQVSDLLWTATMQVEHYNFMQI